VLLSPVILTAGLLAKRETGGEMLFRQRMIGLDGKEFELLKLQTMRPETPGESATKWNIANDDRLGPVGKFLRKTSIDELPQLVNILRGDMSIVGPRPERPHFVEEFSKQYPDYAARHRVPVGLTGLAQVNGMRGDTSIAARVAFDNRYIGAWSLTEDLRIIVGTIPAVIRGEGG
jgi:lipopolysaccharide/colanic/teichoic acid biosynthesis glycosyltransferase